MTTLRGRLTDHICNARIAYMQTMYMEPTRIYLGKREKRRLKEEMEYFGVLKAEVKRPVECVMGLRIYWVNEASHMHLAHVQSDIKTETNTRPMK